MSAPGPSASTRTRFLIAIAILTGAIILLLATEFASMAATPETVDATTSSAAQTGGKS